MCSRPHDARQAWQPRSRFPTERHLPSRIVALVAVFGDHGDKLAERRLFLRRIAGDQRPGLEGRRLVGLAGVFRFCGPVAGRLTGRPAIASRNRIQRRKARCIVNVHDQPRLLR